MRSPCTDHSLQGLLLVDELLHLIHQPLQGSRLFPSQLLHIFFFWWLPLIKSCINHVVGVIFHDHLFSSLKLATKSLSVSPLLFCKVSKFPEGFLRIRAAMNCPKNSLLIPSNKSPDPEDGLLNQCRAFTVRISGNARKATSSGVPCMSRWTRKFSICSTGSPIPT